jgi:hypothetical protein
MGVEHNFDELERDIEGLQARTNGIASDSAEAMAEQMKRKVINIIKGASTSKGGTFNSDSSPYSPGGVNDSETGANIHLTDEAAWRTTVKDSGGGQSGSSTYRFLPIEDVEMRADMINRGTIGKDITPNNNEGNPMYFQYGSYTIIVSDVDPEATTTARFEGDPKPGGVEGVEPLNFIDKGVAILRIQSRQIARGTFRRKLQDKQFDTLELNPSE